MTRRAGDWIGRLGVVVLLAVAMAFAAQAGGTDQGFTTKAPRAILLDAATGAVLLQVNSDELAPPASMSKLMTLAVVFKALDEGKLKGSDEFVMSVNAWRKGGAPSGTAAMMVPVNTKATVDELIQGIAVQSGNDASIAIAEGMAGSEAAFAKLMNAEARRIGLLRSTFANATGLPHDNHLMTVRELALLARHLMTQYPERYRVFSQKEFPYRKHKFYNRNPLLFMSVGADGLKTGYTKEAGHGLVASAQRDGKRLIMVLGGLTTPEERKREAVRLLEWGFNSFSTVVVFPEGEIVGQARVWGGDSMYVPLAGDGDVTMSLPKYPANQRLSAEIMYRAPLKAPVKKGDRVATLKVQSTSSASAEIPLYAQEDIGEAGIMRRGLDSLLIMALRRLAL